MHSTMQKICTVDGCDRLPRSRGWCSKHYQRWLRGRDLGYEKPRYTTCAAPGCKSSVRSPGCRYCEMHYGRLRRNGTLSQRRPDSIKEHSNGYLLRYAPDHPLRRPPNPRVYEHRRVFYDAHGAGPFQCHWCSMEVTWDIMHVDHLNDNPKDNRLANLVASCPRCNKKRGEHKMKAAMRRRGRLLTYRGQTMCMSDWAREIGISTAALQFRLSSDWPMDRVFTEPRGKFGPKPESPGQA